MDESAPPFGEAFRRDVSIFSWMNATPFEGI
jgi:hypothetical protein